ncbi:MAG: hypothetical protein GY953_05080, partial [bacterium]|nr:hypothetical protein [bacterium]
MPSPVPGVEKSAARITRGEIWLIALLVLAGFAVRLPRLTESLWYDEIAAWRDYGSKGPAVILTTHHDPANHVAHTLLSWVSFETLSEALGPEIALRLPALLFSLGSIAAMYGLARCV